jgi:predicted CXXCH cytochrome family protein
MKIVKISLILVAAVALTLGLGNTSFAFHSGGVAECEGCHSMHNSFEGSTNVTGRTFAQGTGPFLLKANEPAGACLNCHNSADSVATGYHISTDGITPYNTSAPVEMTPGGDFAWLKKTMSFIVRSNTTTNDGSRHGHNIVSADYGYVQDDALTVAPGGTYPAASLACSSCHDPHGRYRRDWITSGSYSTTGKPIFNSGSYNNSANPVGTVSAVGAYRILGGNGYLPKSMSTQPALAFTQDPMDVVVATTYNRSEATDQTGIFYGKNVSEWCANCHTSMLINGYTSGMAGLRHPASNGEKLDSFIVTNYNAYVSSGIMTNTNTAKAFSTLAPFATDTQDRATMKPAATTGTGGLSNHPAAATTDNVMCLSCHRAHATAFESMLRWNYAGNEFMTAADSAGVALYDTVNGKGTGYDTTLQTNAYYGRTAASFGPNARSFCNKCHAKD